MEEQRNFKAFISYRHCPLDMAVAKRVQNLIERYRIPRAFRKDGQKRLGLVFRDESELPLSSNLTADIYKALDHSEFLIVICTPETPKSLWVKQEIDYFIRTHGRERVLAVLADGKPDESLPEALTHVYGEDGSVLAMIEPLCANLVAEDQDAVLKRLHMEFLRLVAAMLNVPYDNLYQRRKRYLRRRAAALIGSVTAVLVLIMGLLIGWNLEVTAKNKEIAEKHRLAQEKESQALSLLSEQYLAAGDRKAALESALQALEGDRPYLAQAEGALAKALNPYGNGMLSYHLTLEMPTTIQIMDLSEDGTRLVTADHNAIIRCHDTASGKLLWEQQSDPSLVALGSHQMQLVGEDQYLLVNIYDSLQLLSMEDGRELHSLNLLYPGRTFDIPADVFVDEAGEQFTLLYEPEDVHRYEVYDMETFALLDSVQVSEDVDCFFASFPAQDALEAVNVKAAYSSEESKLIIALSDGNRWELENFRPRTVSMDLDELYIHRQKDGSWVLVGYLEDTNYSLSSERRYLSIHKLSPQGEELYRNQFPRGVYYRHQFLGDSLALFADDYNSSLEFTTFATVMQWIDMTGDYRQVEIDFGDAGVHHSYLRQDGQMVTVMNDGSIRTPLKESYGLTYTELPDYGQPIRQALGTNGDREVICLVPEDRTDTVVMLRSDRNDAARPLCGNEEVIRFPSGNRFLTVNYDWENYEQPPQVTVYDAHTLDKLDQFTLETENIFATIFGFSADENRIFFGGNDGYAYDLQTHQVTQIRNAKDALGVEYHQPQSTQIPGQPVVSVIYGGLDDPNEMYWYQNLEKAGSFVFPCEEGELVYQDWPNWNIGANGLIVCSAYDRELVNAITETFVYSTRDQVCHRVPNPTAERDGCDTGVGNVTKVVAFANADSMIRIYDFDKDAFVNSFPLPVSPSEVSALQFVGQDQYLLVFKHNGSMTIMDVASGQVCNELLLDDPVDIHSPFVQEDPANNQLYICTGAGSTTGYRIDMQTWTVTAEIPGLAAFLPQTGQLLQRDFYSGQLMVSPQYTLEELMDKTRELLSAAGEAD